MSKIIKKKVGNTLETVAVIPDQPATFKQMGLMSAQDKRLLVGMSADIENLIAVVSQLQAKVDALSGGSDIASLQSDVDELKNIIKSDTPGVLYNDGTVVGFTQTLDASEE